MSECLNDTLGQIVDRYLNRVGVSKKKYYKSLLVIAEEVWTEVFTRTLWTVESVWQTLKDGDPYPYIDIPKNALQVFSVGEEDKCGNIQPLYYNNQLNVIPKPTTKKCGCGCTECGGLCEDANSMTTTTKLIFSINGIDYYEKCWVQVCPNGQVLQWCETPVKRFNDMLGDPGDYNHDYMNDFDIAHAGFANYTIVYLKTQKVICGGDSGTAALETLPCGCPKDTPENEQILLDTCGCFFNWGTHRRKKHCKRFFENVNDNRRGEVKISQCGTKIYFKRSRRECSETDKKYPDFLLLNFQTDGLKPSQEVLVPKFARKVMYAGIDQAKKEFNNAYSLSEKKAADYKFEDERAKVIEYLNPIDLIFMQQVQDTPIRW